MLLNAHVNDNDVHNHEYIAIVRGSRGRALQIQSASLCTEPCPATADHS